MVQCNKEAVPWQNLRRLGGFSQKSRGHGAWPSELRERFFLQLPQKNARETGERNLTFLPFNNNSSRCSSNNNSGGQHHPIIVIRSSSRSSNGLSLAKEEKLDSDSMTHPMCSTEEDYTRELISDDFKLWVFIILLVKMDETHARSSKQKLIINSNMH
eukprot:5673488-Amphidinium_carterae.1